MKAKYKKFLSWISIIISVGILFLILGFVSFPLTLLQKALCWFAIFNIIISINELRNKKEVEKKQTSPPKTIKQEISSLKNNTISSYWK